MSPRCVTPDGEGPGGQPGGRESERHVCCTQDMFVTVVGYPADPRCEMSEHTDVDHPERDQRWNSRCPCEDRNRNGWIATGPACLRASGRTDRRSAADGVSADIAVSAALRPSRRHHAGDLSGDCLLFGGRDTDIGRARCHAPAEVPAPPARDCGVGGAPDGLCRAGAARSRAPRRDGRGLRGCLRLARRRRWRVASYW